MTLYSDLAVITGGTTVDVYGTSVNVTLNAKARKIRYFINSGVDTTFTAAEGAADQLRLNAQAISGATNLVWGVGPYTTSGPATNSSGQCMTPEIIPVEFNVKGSEVLTFDYAPTATITTGRLHNLQVIYDDMQAAPTQDWLDWFPNCMPSKWGAAVDASQLTTTQTALAAISVPSWVSLLMGNKSLILKTGAITTAEEGLGRFQMDSSIPDVAPQIWTTNGQGATLGTPVGTGQFHERNPYIPMYVESTGKNETITPRITLNTAITTANRVTFAVIGR